MINANGGIKMTNGIQNETPRMYTVSGYHTASLYSNSRKAIHMIYPGIDAAISHMKNDPVSHTTSIIDNINLEDKKVVSEAR